MFRFVSLLLSFSAALSASSIAHASENLERAFAKAYVIEVSNAERPGDGGKFLEVNIGGTDIEKIAATLKFEPTQGNPSAKCRTEKTYDGDYTGDYLCTFTLNSAGKFVPHLPSGLFSVKSLGAAPISVKEFKSALAITFTGQVASALRGFLPLSSKFMAKLAPTIVLGKGGELQSATGLFK